jgi:hypothetical protein
MRRAVFRRTTTGMALFPFLAVLICTMGSLIVLLVLILQNSRVQASVAGRSTSSSATSSVVNMKRPDPAAEKTRQEQAELARRLRQEFEDHQWRREMLEAQRAEQLENLSRQRKELAHLEDHVRRLEDQWKQLNSQAKELQSLQDDKASEKADQEQAAAEELAKLKELVEAKKKEVEETKKKISDGPKSYALVPYIGKNGTRRRPIYVECAEEGIILHPEGVVFLPSDFQGPLGPGNPLDAALRTVREHWLKQPDAAREGEPYPLLIVRPNGAVAYSMARAAMKTWEEEFGYELVEEDLKLEFPPPDPELESLLTRSMKDARARQTVLAASMPSRYKNANQPVASTPSAGFAAAPYQDDGAPASGRGNGGGFGAGGSGMSGSGMSGSGMSGSGATSGNNLNSGGNPPSGSPGLNGAQGGVPGGANSPNTNAALGAGGSGSGREGGSFLGGSPGGAASVDSGSDRGFGFGAGGGTGQGMSVDAGGGAPGEGGVAGGGGFGSGSGGLARGNGSPQSGTPPADGNQAPGSQFVSAGPGAGGAKGGAAGGGSFQGNAGAGGAPGPGAFGGGSNGFGAANGATMSGPDGSPPPNATGDARGSSSSSGSNLSDGSGQASTTFSTNSSNAKVRRTGPDWALRNKTHSATAITRPIRIRCLVDRLVILPEKGDDQRQQVIPTPGGAQAAIEPFVTAIWRQTDRWGLAVSNGYWKPVLNVEVGPGAENNFRQLEAALQGSGLEVVRK